MDSAYYSVVEDVRGLLDPPATSAEDARRRRLISAVLLTQMACALVAGAVLLVYSIANPDVVYSTSEVPSVAFFVASYYAYTGVGVVVVVFALNRYGPSLLAGLAWVVGWGVVLAFGLPIESLVQSPLLLTYVLPVCGAALLLRPWAGVVTAAASALLPASVALFGNAQPSWVWPAVVLMVGLAVWPVARQLRGRWIPAKWRAKDSAGLSLAGDLRSLLEIRAADPDRLRRGRLLNLVLVGLWGVLVVTFLMSLVYTVAALSWPHLAYDETMMGVDWLTALLASVFVLIFLLNRYGSQGIAAGCLLALLSAAAVVYSLPPEEMVRGYGVPIPLFLVSLTAFLLPPWTAFVIAGLFSLLGVGAALWSGLAPNYYNVTMYFCAAWLLWLVSRSLERALRETRAESEKTAAIVESIADGVIVFERDGTVVDVNPAAVTLVFGGMAESDVRGRPLDEVIRGMLDSGQAGAWQRLLGRMMRGPYPLRLEPFEWQGRTLSVSVSEMMEAGGVAGRRVAAVRDLTRETEAERARKAMFAVATHELKTPLSSIIGYAEALRGEVAPEKLAESLARIEQGGRRLSATISNILQQARLEAGELDLHSTPVDIREVVENECGVLQVLVQTKRVELVWAVDDDVPDEIETDPRWVAHIVTNLVDNAIKFTDEGRVEVRVALAGGDRWRLEVLDTGRGIEEDARERIFEPFLVGGDPRTRDRQGTGLGLSIVRRLVTLMGGEVTVESEVGKGSTFRVILPFGESDAVAQSAGVRG